LQWPFSKKSPSSNAHITHPSSTPRPLQSHPYNYINSSPLHHTLFDLEKQNDTLINVTNDRFCTIKNKMELIPPSLFSVVPTNKINPLGMVLEKDDFDLIWLLYDDFSFQAIKRR
jgi:hypothetical protein